jgi:hypothetical protein
VIEDDRPGEDRSVNFTQPGLVEDGALRLQLLDGVEDVVLADRRIAQDVGADEEDIL